MSEKYLREDPQTGDLTGGSVEVSAQERILLAIIDAQEEAQREFGRLLGGQESRRKLGSGEVELLGRIEALDFAYAVTTKGQEGDGIRLAAHVLGQDNAKKTWKGRAIRAGQGMFEELPAGGQVWQKLAGSGEEDLLAACAETKADRWRERTGPVAWKDREKARQYFEKLGRETLGKSRGAEAWLPGLLSEGKMLAAADLPPGYEAHYKALASEIGTGFFVTSSGEILA